MISQRDAFFNSLFAIAREDRNIILVSADCGAPALDQWRAELPRQFFNCGIAEQGGLSIAAGLALEGKRPYFYAIAPFATLRCLEQIRVNMAIMRLPIVIVGVGAGLSYEDSGPTHHALEDLAIMRALSGITIWNVTDSVMAGKVAAISHQENRPAYVRLDREAREPIYGEHAKFEAGFDRLYAGNYSVSPVEIVATGNMVYVAIKIAEAYKMGCIDIYRFPIDGARLKEDMIDPGSTIITMEEHYLPGGLGSAVAEVLADQGLRLQLHRVGIRDEQPYSYVYGGREKTRDSYGIGVEAVEKILRNPPDGK